MLVPEHIAIIMDGNGRWARSKNLTRMDGHKKGADVAKSITIAANELKVKHLTLYAFSSENWQRSEIEISNLFDIFKFYLTQDTGFIEKNNIKLSIIGDLAKVPNALRKQIEKIVSRTQNNSGLNLVIAFSYGSRDEIVKAIKDLNRSSIEVTIESLSKHLYTNCIPDPDLLIRTGGEKRLSNFLLWQIAYTELLFLDKYWPDFNQEDLKLAIKEFNKRDRKYGK